MNGEREREQDDASGEPEHGPASSPRFKLDPERLAKRDSPVLQAGLDITRALGSWLQSVDSMGLTVPGNDRALLAVAAHDLAVEHFAAAVVLIDQGCWGSASALLRCQVDAYAQGLYLSDVIPQQTIELLKAYKFAPESGAMYRAVLKIPRIKASPLGRILQRHQKAMHSYTHGGIFQLVRRLREDSVEPTFHEVALLETLAFMGSVAMSSQREAMGLMNRPDLQEAVDRRWREDMHAWTEFGLDIQAGAPLDV